MSERMAYKCDMKTDKKEKRKREAEIDTNSAGARFRNTKKKIERNCHSSLILYSSYIGIKYVMRFEVEPIEIIVSLLSSSSVRCCFC